MRHHSEGIFWCEERFGISIINSAGKEIPVRAIGEMHVIEDLGWIPSIKDWLSNMKVEQWMNKPGLKRDERKTFSERKGVCDFSEVQSGDN